MSSTGRIGKATCKNIWRAWVRMSHVCRTTEKEEQDKEERMRLKKKDADTLMRLDKDEDGALCVKEAEERQEKQAWGAYEAERKLLFSARAFAVAGWGALEVRMILVGSFCGSDACLFYAGLAPLLRGHARRVLGVASSRLFRRHSGGPAQV